MILKKYLKNTLKHTDKYHISYEYAKFISSYLTMALDLLYTDTKPYINIISHDNLRLHNETLKLYKLGKLGNESFVNLVPFRKISQPVVS